MTDDDTITRTLLAAASLDDAVTALRDHAADATTDPTTMRRLALTVVARCDQLVMASSFDQEQADLDEAFDRFMVGSGELDDRELFAAAL